MSRARRGSDRPRSCPGCQDGGIDDPNTARFRLEVIKVPLAAPATGGDRELAARLQRPAGAAAQCRTRRGRPRAALAARSRRSRRRAGCARARTGCAGCAGRGRRRARRRAGGGRGGRRGRRPARTSATTSRSIPTSASRAAPAAASGCCSTSATSRDPMRIDFVADKNMSFWHSATFSNDGKKVLFTDEWGGGNAPRCRDTDKPEWGANALFTIENNKMMFHSYYKLPAPQTAQENCVAHNGSLIPIPGREVMVQGWYQGGAVGLRLDRREESAGDRVLRSRSAPGRPPALGRLLVRLLVQRPDRELGDRARARHLRAAAERPAQRERDRRGQDRQAGLLEPADAAEVSSGRRASRWRAPTSISSSGRRGSRPTRSPSPGRR